MRTQRILFFLVLGALVFGPAAATVRQAETPPAAKDKARVEATVAAQTAPVQEAKSAPAAAKKPVKKAEIKRTEPIMPAYTGIKEKTGVIVFFVWLWFAIAILIYFLRLWIKEADRVYWAKYYEPEESPRKDNPMAPVLGD